MPNLSSDNSQKWSTIDIYFPKYVRFIIFIVFVFLVLETIFKIMQFFNINSKTGFTYFIWFSLLLFLFVVLPIKRSIFS